MGGCSNYYLFCAIGGALAASIPHTASATTMLMCSLRLLGGRLRPVTRSLGPFTSRCARLPNGMRWRSILLAAHVLGRPRLVLWR